MEALKFAANGKEYRIRYNEIGDVLYVLSDQSLTPNSVVTDNRFQWRFSSDSKTAAGFTSFDFNYLWLNNPIAFKNEIKSGMNLDEEAAELLARAIFDFAGGKVKDPSEWFAGLDY